MCGDWNRCSVSQPRFLIYASTATSPNSPLFVSWNIYASSKRASSPRLRGCIGVFKAVPLVKGLEQYAKTRRASAMESFRDIPTRRHAD